VIAPVPSIDPASNATPKNMTNISSPVSGAAVNTILVPPVDIL